MKLNEANIMHSQRFLAPAAALLLSLSLIGCNHPKANQPAQTQAANQNSANQPASSATPGNGATNNMSPPTFSNSVASTAAPTASNNGTANGVQAPNTAPSSNAPVAPAAANANAQPAPQPLIIPAGTSITVRLQQSLSSASASPGERFEAVIDRPVIVDERIVLPVGTMVMGHVTVARRSGRLRHPGELGLTLDTVSLGQQQIPLATGSVVAHGSSHKKRNWAWMGGGAGGGAVIGALAAGGKGALIGGPIGLAAGTTTAFITGKKDVGFGAERRLSFRLRYDVSVSG